MTSSFAHRCARMRPWLAMVAAYALALQVLLAGFVPMSPLAVAGDGHSPVICFGGGDHAGAPDAPASQPSHAQCCVMCGVFRVAPPAPGAVIARLQIVSRIDFPSPRAAGHVPSRHASPRQSQGPPHTA